MRQAPKLWVPILATVMFGGVGATTWSWVTASDSAAKNGAERLSDGQVKVARTMTPSGQTDFPLTQPGGTSMTCDEKYVFIFSANRLMKVDKDTLQIVSSADIVQKKPVLAARTNIDGAKASAVAQ